MTDASCSHTRQPDPAARLLRPLALLLVFLVLPWLHWQGQPVLQLDLANRQLYLPGLSARIDNAAVVLALIIAAVAGLCLVTALTGRLWCGRACPQLMLGQLHARLSRKLPRKTAALAWALLAGVIGVHFVGYFLPIRSLVLFPFNGWTLLGAAWAGFYALATWANIAYLGSRVCTQFCPFARIQPWITDPRTPHVRYDAPRGEPRGPRAADLGSLSKRGRRLLDPDTARDYVVRAANPTLSGALPRFAPSRLGDCTDCGRCVQACPLQLDIRHGLDARCLDCGLCQTACDREMRARGYPGGLIAHAAAPQQAIPLPHWKRPTLLASAAVLCAALATACWLA